MRELFAALLAGAIVLALTPLVRRWVVRLGLLKPPSDRSMHSRPMPHMGGLAIIGGFTITAAAVAWHSPGVPGLLAGGLVIALVGVVDDVWNLRPWQKLLGQIASGIVLAVLGSRIGWVTNPFGGILYTGLIGYVLTVVWVVAVENMVNLADGLDGLASGITAIASLAMLVVSLHRGDIVSAVLSAAIAGATIGFLRDNFAPANIFLGDTGAMYLGYVLAALAVLGTDKQAAALAIGVPVLALGLPFFDTAFAIVRRIRSHQPIGQADAGHLHHRLIDRGLSQRRAVLLLYTVAVTCGLGAVLVVLLPRGLGFALVAALLLGLVIVGMRSGILVVHAKATPIAQPRDHGVAR
jgi:UDP-GlcNAc:undecaprenyl-phosphate GlcNAc-1-phosphate transferase